MGLLVKLGCGKYTFIDRNNSDPHHRLLDNPEPDIYDLDRWNVHECSSATEYLSKTSNHFLKKRADSCHRRQS